MEPVLNLMPSIGTALCNLLFFFFKSQNHNLSPKYDFHSYMIRSMEEEFQRIVGVR